MTPEEIIKDIIARYETEVHSWREYRIREWRRNHLYWDGKSHLWWSATADDWRYPSIATIGELDQYDLDEDEGRTINVFEAHGRSIVAALASKIPGVRFYPKDAEDYRDIMTAQTYDKVADIVFKENNFPMLFAKALFLLFNEDYVAAHVFNESKFEYGHQYEEIMDEMGDIDHYVEQPKSKTKIDIYGALHVTIPPFVRKQEGMPYLILRSEMHRSEAIEMYGTTQDLRDRIMHSAYSDEEEDIASIVRNDEENTVVLKEVWLRPWALFNTDAYDEAQTMRKKYPEGVKITYVNNEQVMIENESLDKHWIIASDPLSYYLTGRPMGDNLTSIQEMTDDLVDLTMQTIAHGIPLEWADPRVVNIDALKDRENSPGTVYPAKAPMGKSLRDSFHSSDKATLSREVAAFTEYVNYAGQFVSGDFPSVHGASLEGGSRTASEYAQSRQHALQRLSIPYSSMGEFVAMIKMMCAKLYISSLKDDELIGTEFKDGAFLNVWVRMQDITGNIGSVEPVNSDVFPNTPAMVRDMFMNLLERQHPLMDQVLADPNNLPVLTNALGLPELYVPGEDDRAKQWGEIQQLINSDPVLDGQPLPAVQVQLEVDNHEIEAHVCLTFLKSPQGQMLKQTNPTGYLNVLLHYMQHNQAIMPEIPPAPPQEGTSGPRE